MGVIVSIVGANILGIALTWSVGGRFMAPVQPLLAALAGAMVVALVRQTIEFGMRFRPREPEGSAVAG